MNINNLSFGYNESCRIIDNFSICVDQGSNIMLLGDNGTGKSTLGKLICGILKPQNGYVEIDKKKVYHLKPKDRISKAYYITQLNHLQIVKNTILKEINQVEKITGRQFDPKEYEMFYLPENMDFMPLELTVNQAWRFSLFLADLINPKVLFIDEVVSSVNRLNNTVLAKTLQKRKTDNKITFISYQRLIDFPFDLQMELGENGNLQVI